ncbi:uncharacterized protein LOC114735183 [Neltuma alba]|uniref:uncharacterized protein LOC114735183 n=1 Tax=Neltuma alba TaxID=207710 RepID=UPI0010A587EB|nr:uncharacterized protein LOC114735183 [Prosopis alba]
MPLNLDLNSDEIGADDGEFLLDLNKLPSDFQGVDEVYLGEILDNEYDVEQQIEEEHIYASETNGDQRKFLSNEDRKAISHLLLQHSKGGRLIKGARKKIASMYSVSNSVIKRIW